ncbi:MAG: carbohydrate ABC transporter permease [Treponema sp.]|jgi:raffinose/stachyose/melibiose transport system permease protein|nr:carbohydrate ABC transporter permease [Treponema sp.]
MAARTSFGKATRIIKHFIYCFIAFFQLYPLVWLAFFSLKNNNQIFIGNIAGFPNPLVWKNYQQIITNGHVFRFFINSIIITGSTLILSTIMISMVSYGIIRMKWRFQKAALTYILIGLTVPSQAVLLPIFKTLQFLKVFNTYFALILPYTAFSIPLGVSIMSGYLHTIPYELEEASLIDGCSVYQMFFRIIFPLLQGAIVPISIFTFLYCWNELMFAITFVNKQNLKALTSGIMTLMGRYSTEWGVIGAGLFITVIPILIFYMSFGKRIQESLLVGAVKG